MNPRPPARLDVDTQLETAHSESLGLGVCRLSLFGSVQQNAAPVDSDVNVLVEFAPGMKSFDRLISLGDLLEARSIGHTFFTALLDHNIS